MQAVKASVPALAEAMESLRANMVIFRYQIRYAGFGKHKLSESLNVLKPDLERYALLVQQIKNKTKERKTLLAEKKATPFYQFVAHNDLAKKIAELTEDLEELKSEKTMLLSSFDCSEDTGIAEVKKSVAAMEENLKRLTKQEEKYAAELDFSGGFQLAAANLVAVFIEGHRFQTAIFVRHLERKQAIVLHGLFAHRLSV